MFDLINKLLQPQKSCHIRSATKVYEAKKNGAKIIHLRMHAFISQYAVCDETYIAITETYFPSNFSKWYLA